MGKEETLKFQPIPLPGGLAAYGAMDTHSDFMDLAHDISVQNQAWFRQNADPSSLWAIVVGDKIVEQSKALPLPNRISIRRHGTNTFPPYLVIRDTTPRDIRILFEKKHLELVQSTLGANPADFEHHEPSSFSLETHATQSGALNKLVPYFALGKIRVLNIHGHTSGATTVIVQRPLFDGKQLYMSSQIAEHVHARGQKTSEERYPEQFLRVERRHRFDDPKVDIFDTYNMIRQQGWPDLLLYWNRAKHPTIKF
jgi:hypothetical protein